MSTIPRRSVRSPAQIERTSITPSRAASQRDACVVEVTENSPPVLFHAGESMRLERLPVGSRVVYPPPPLSGLADPQAAIAAALDNPLGMRSAWTLCCGRACG